MELDEPISMAENRRQNIVQTVKDYGSRLFAFIRGKVNSDEDAEDILQDVWYQFTNTSATQTIDQVSGWLYAVARNKITDRYRKKQPSLIDDLGYGEENGDLSLGDFLFADDEDPAFAQIRELFWEELAAALEELPLKQRQVFVWNELEDKTLQEIADSEGENLKTIISRKRYAVQHLRKRLEYLYNELENY
jgi:RNA polymerase sigma factor (sigma-70 family)